MSMGRRRQAVINCIRVQHIDYMTIIEIISDYTYLSHYYLQGIYNISVDAIYTELQW